MIFQSRDLPITCAFIFSPSHAPIHLPPCYAVRRFDFLTSTWYMYPPESTAPPLLQAAAVRVSPNAAIVFGGMTDQRQSSGAVLQFAVGRGAHAPHARTRLR